MVTVSDDAIARSNVPHRRDDRDDRDDRDELGRRRRQLGHGGEPTCHGPGTGSDRRAVPSAAPVLSALTENRRCIGAAALLSAPAASGTLFSRSRCPPRPATFRMRGGSAVHGGRTAPAGAPQPGHPSVAGDAHAERDGWLARGGGDRAQATTAVAHQEELLRAGRRRISLARIASNDLTPGTCVLFMNADGAGGTWEPSTSSSGSSGRWSADACLLGDRQLSPRLDLQPCVEDRLAAAQRLPYVPALQATLSRRSPSTRRMGISTTASSVPRSTRSSTWPASSSCGVVGASRRVRGPVRAPVRPRRLRAPCSTARVLVSPASPVVYPAVSQRAGSRLSGRRRVQHVRESRRQRT